MPAATIARAVLLFVVTNIDDLVVLSLLLHRAGRRTGGRQQVVLGQFLGMAGIVAISLVGAAGAQLLPPGPREGVVVNLPEHRLYFFPKPRRGEKPTVMTFPVSVGKMDWRTPIGVTKVVSKQKDPPWYPPESVLKEHAARGEPLPEVVPPGPDNPLGAHALRLNIPGGSYLIHGTNNPDAVGMAVTHGCLRMYPEDVERLFDVTPVGTRVALINEPVKLARFDGEVWLEVHPPVDENGQVIAVDLEAFETRLDALLGEAEVLIDWEAALRVMREATGMPTLIGLELAPEGGPSVPDPAP